MVSVLVFYSNDPGLNPAEAYCFSVNVVFKKNVNRQKEAGIGQNKKSTFKSKSAD